MNNQASQNFNPAKRYSARFGKMTAAITAAWLLICMFFSSTLPSADYTAAYVWIAGGSVVLYLITKWRRLKREGITLSREQIEQQTKRESCAKVTSLIGIFLLIAPLLLTYLLPAINHFKGIHIINMISVLTGLVIIFFTGMYS